MKTITVCADLSNDSENYYHFQQRLLWSGLSTTRRPAKVGRTRLDEAPVSEATITSRRLRRLRAT
jgi:hypothetical protein